MNNRLSEEIKSRIDIVDLVSEHVNLKKAGQNYKGLCPFHSEKTPSFTVSPSKQIFHCFGCNKGGDVFAFVMSHENMSFQEAVSYLAQKAGVKTEEFRGSGSGRGFKEDLLGIYKEAVIFFQDNLKNSKQTLSYLKERGIKDETIETFSLGCAKNEKDALFNRLKKSGFAPESIKASGVVNFGERGIYDFFRERLMFPIFDLQGRPIAFGGRTLSSLKNIPKYINSSDSPIFKKGETAYALNLAKSAITQKGYSIVVEGYLDAIMCRQYGFANAVAPLGTALTNGQLKKLKRFSNKTLLIFDGDAAGISATKRSLELCYAEGMIAKILLMPKGEDPDTFLRKHGEEYFRKYLGRAITPVDFVLKASSNKLDAVRYMLTALSSCPDPLQRDETVRELADKSRINETTLREELKNSGQKKFGQASAQRPKEILPASTNREELILLNIALSMPEKAEGIVKRLSGDLTGDFPADIEDPVALRVFEGMKKVLREDGRITINRLLSSCGDEEQKLITRLSINAEIDPEHVDENIQDCLKKIVLRNLEKQIKSAEQTGDEKLLHILISQKIAITRRRE
jgi:DNA primase